MTVNTDLAALKSDRSILIQALLAAGANITGNAVKCPFHDDNTPSAGIFEAEGTWLFKCQACGTSGTAIDVVMRARNCDLREAVAHLGGKASDSNGATDRSGTPHGHTSLDEALTATCRRKGWALEEKYYYRDDFYVVRFLDRAGDKAIRPFSRHDGQWVNERPTGDLPLYNSGILEGLPGNSRVFVVEGEKCVNLAKRLGLVAVTSAFGSRSARRTDWRPIGRFDVVLLPDRDESGESYIREVCDLIGKPCRVLRLDVGDGEDIEQWIEAHDCRASEELGELLGAMANEAPVMDPTSDLDPSAGDTLPPPLSPAWTSIGEVIAEDDYGRGVAFISSGFKQVDDLLGSGFAAGNVHIIAGRTGSAKSMLACNLARLIALDGRTVLMMTLEDEIRHAAWRIHAAAANTPLGVFLRGTTEQDGPGIVAIRSTRDLVGELSLRLSAIRDLNHICDLIETHVRDDGDVVIIDQLSKISLPGISDPYERASTISERLRLVAREQRIPVIAVCQVNRPASKKTEDLGIHDLRDSGMLEQDAATVMLLDKAEDPPDADSRPQLVKLLPVTLGKNRFGPAGETVKLLWYPRTCRIDESGQ